MVRIVAVIVLAALSASAQAAGIPDEAWRTAEREALAHLKALIRIDTSNPPGNEILAARYLRDALSRDGIRSELLISSGTRGSLVARLPGSGRKRPLLIICHTDVVPADRSKWSVDPFGAVEKDGYLYGRGAADIKGMCAAELTVMSLLRRHQVSLDRDVIFLAQADEESGGSDRHLDWLIDKHFDKLDAEFGINEGGFILWRDGRIAAIDLQCGEKQYLDLNLSVRGKAGHSSKPGREDAVHVLVRALGRLADWEPEFEFPEVSMAYLRAVREDSSPELRREINRLLGAEGKARSAAARAIAGLSPEHGAILKDTCAVTILKAGYKSNVIPATAEAVVNCRLLPGSDVARFVSSLQDVMREPGVEVGYTRPKFPSPPAMPIDSELFRAVENAAGELAPGAPVRPYMAAWSTDSLAFRARGVKVYGLDPPLTVEDGERSHGADERIPVAALGPYLKLLYGVVLRLAAARQSAP